MASCGIDIKQNNRESNFELLRLVAMFAILFWHGIHHGFLHYRFFTSFELSVLGIIRYLLIWHVDIFLLITGYFGVKFKWLKVFKFYGYVLSYFAVLSVVTAFWQNNPLDLYGTLCAPYTFFNGGLGWWFVKPYLYLLLLSPLLEKIRNVSDKEYVMVLIPLSVLNILIGHFIQRSFDSGFDVGHFVFMYILGMGLKRLENNKKVSGVNGWLVVLLIIVNSIMLYLLRVFCGYANMDGYNNPLIILNAACLLLLFERIKFHSSFVNIIAGSAFAVYLITDNAFLTRSYIVLITNKIAETCNANVFLVLLVWFLICVFIYGICLLFDITIKHSLYTLRAFVTKER